MNLPRLGHAALIFSISFPTFVALGLLHDLGTSNHSNSSSDTDAVVSTNNSFEITDSNLNFFVENDLRFELPEDQSIRKLATMPNLRLWDQWWQNGYYWIKVYLDPSYSDDSRKTIIKALRSLQYRGKVVKFKIAYNKPGDGKPYLNITNNDECWSWLGRRSRADLGQEIGIDENGCMYDGTIQHEVLHALGFAHEHQRPDRDDYVDINLDNVRPNRVDAFSILKSINSLEVPYDYNSVMHYGKFSFSKNDLPTIVPKNGNVINYLEKASWLDIVQLRLMYQCKPETGPRSNSAFKANPCTEDCPCWKKRTGCKVNGVNMSSLCKGSLVCHQNTCKDKFPDSKDY